MNQPNPWILFMEGISLLTLTGAVGGMQAPAWARYVGMAACASLGLCSMVLGLMRYFQKKPERTKYVPKRKRAQTDKQA